MRGQEQLLLQDSETLRTGQSYPVPVAANEGTDLRGCLLFFANNAVHVKRWSEDWSMTIEMEECAILNRNPTMLNQDVAVTRKPPTTIEGDDSKGTMRLKSQPLHD